MDVLPRKHDQCRVAGTILQGFDECRREDPHARSVAKHASRSVRAPKESRGIPTIQACRPIIFFPKIRRKFAIQPHTIVPILAATSPRREPTCMYLGNTVLFAFPFLSGTFRNCSGTFRRTNCRLCSNYSVGIRSLIFVDNSKRDGWMASVDMLVTQNVIA